MAGERESRSFSCSTSNHQPSFLSAAAVSCSILNFSFWGGKEAESTSEESYRVSFFFLFFFSSVNFNLRPWREKLLLRSFFFLFCKESLDSQTFCVRAIVLITVDKKAAYISRLRSSVWVGFSAQVSVMRCIFGATWQTARKDNFFLIVNFIMCSVFIINTDSCFKKQQPCFSKMF